MPNEVVWILVAVLLIALVVLLVRRPGNPWAAPLDRLAREMEKGDEARVGLSAEGDPPEVAALRRAVATGWAPIQEGSDEDPEDRAVRGLVRYLRGAALAPLRSGLSGGRGLQDAATEVADALEDLLFYAEPVPEEESERVNVVSLAQEIARDYIAETNIPVKHAYSSSTVQADVAPEAFRDALFMLLSNAGHFGSGSGIQVQIEDGPESVRVRVRDRGEGFSDEALEHAFEPFWSSDEDALGMGLTHARRVLVARGMRLRIGNREEGGAEGVIIIPKG